MRLLNPPARLRVPLGARSPVPAPVGVAVGSSVAKGQLLADSKVEGGAAALAPTSGRIVGVSDVTLTNGQVVPAVELETDFEDRSLPPELDPAPGAAPDSFDKITRDDLGAWIDRLRGSPVAAT